MTYITEFAVEGLVGRKDTYVQKLNRDVNIFFGVNGSGKTSLLKILHSALSYDTRPLRGVPFTGAEVKFYSINYEKVITRTITQRKLEVERDDHRDQARDLDRGKPRESAEDDFKWETDMVIQPARPVRFGHAYLPTSRLWFSETMRRARYVETESALDNNFQDILRTLWITYTRGVLGTVRNAQEEGLTNILKGVLAPDEKHSKSNHEALDANTAFKRVKSFLERQQAQRILGSKEAFTSRYSKSRVLKNVVNYIDEVEVRIDEAMSPRNKLQELITRLFRKGKTVQFTDETIEFSLEDNTKILLSSLSSGEKHLLRILVEVLNVSENSLLIDEPEISMHVDWQRELVASMRSVNSQTQLILATHSPEIMADVDDDKIFSI